MRPLTKIIFNKSFWWLFLIGLNLALGQMPFDFPFWSFCSLIVLGTAWVKYRPSAYEALIWGLGLGYGYFGLTFFWLVEPFLVKASETGWMAPFAVIGLVSFLSIILSMNFFFAAKFSTGKNNTFSLIILSIFLAESPIELALIIAFFGFGLGGALPLSNILFTKTYTEQSFGRARGLAGPFLLPIQVAGTPLAAFLFDLYGNYNLAFSILGIAPTLGIITIWFLRLPKKGA